MTPTKASLEALATMVVGMVADWGDLLNPVAPHARAELLAALPHLLVDGPDRDEYLQHLCRVRQASGRVTALNAVAERVELPTETLLLDGLGNLTDEQLAVLAVEPCLLRNLAALIDESARAGEVGAVWWQAMDRAGARIASAKDRTSADPAYRDHTLVPAPTPDPALIEDVEPLGLCGLETTQHRGWRRRDILPWTIATATLLFALWGWWPKRTGPVGELATTSTLTRAGVLGPDAVYSLAVRPPEDGFVTVVLVPPDGPPCRVYPGYGANDVVAPKGIHTRVDDLSGRPGTRVIAFITGTPAAETVRKAVDTLPRNPNVTDAVIAQTVTAALRSARHPWVAVSEVQIMPNP